MKRVKIAAKRAGWQLVTEHYEKNCNCFCNINPSDPFFFAANTQTVLLRLY